MTKRHARAGPMPVDRRLPINELINGSGSAPPVRRLVQTNRQHVHRFVENDREYYAYRNDVAYPFPIDEDESDRLDVFCLIIHKIALNGRLHNAELRPHGRRTQVLDVGCGNGLWAFEMGEKFPDVDVAGIDLIDIQPERDTAIPNVTFHTPVDFLGQDWGFPEQSFDFIRMSQLCGCVPDWLSMYGNVYKYLRSGTGFIEHIEFDWEPRFPHERGYSPQAQPLTEWWERMRQASSFLGKPIVCPEDTENTLTRAGFTDITHRTVRIPVQQRVEDPRDDLMSRWFQSIIAGTNEQGHSSQLFESLSLSLFTRQLRMQPQHVKEWMRTLRNIYASKRVPLYHNIHIWTARKPKSETVVFSLVRAGAYLPINSPAQAIQSLQQSTTLIMAALWEYLVPGIPEQYVLTQRGVWSAGLTALMHEEMVGT